MFQHIVTAWRIDRGCSRMLEHAKADLIQQSSSWLLYNIVVQSCYFIIPWHVLSCMYMAVDLTWWFQQHCSSLFVHQQPCSSWPAQPCSSLSTNMFKLASSTSKIDKLCVFMYVAQFGMASTDCMPKYPHDFKQFLLTFKNILTLKERKKGIQ